MYTRRRLAALFCLVVTGAGCSRQPEPRPSLAVAAAANLMQALTVAGPRFEEQTGIHPVFSFASTAQLTEQIENGAPFDIFLAADASHVDELDRKHLLVAGSRAVYAIGVLALWIPPGSSAPVSRVEDLASAAVKTIAIAKPELAPYGEAAVETLQSARIWDQVQPKIVYAENIAMARQYGDSGNADVVFTAYSLVLHDPGKVIQVDEKLHRPIEQALGIVAASSRQAAAHKFAAFFLHGPGRDILREYGYGIPR